jgi:hypothetical protein
LQTVLAADLPITEDMLHSTAQKIGQTLECGSCKLLLEFATRTIDHAGTTANTFVEETYTEHRDNFSENKTVRAMNHRRLCFQQFYDNDFQAKVEVRHYHALTQHGAAKDVSLTLRAPHVGNSRFPSVALYSGMLPCGAEAHWDRVCVEYEEYLEGLSVSADFHSTLISLQKLCKWPKTLAPDTCVLVVVKGPHQLVVQKNGSCTMCGSVKLASTLHTACLMPFRALNSVLVACLGGFLLPTATATFYRTNTVEAPIPQATSTRTATNTNDNSHSNYTD